MSEVIDEVSLERKRQDEKWGEQNHGLAAWIAILGEEFGELCQAVLEGDIFDNGRRGEFPIDEIRREAIQVAAVAVAMVECIDRNEYYRTKVSDYSLADEEARNGE